MEPGRNVAALGRFLGAQRALVAAAAVGLLVRVAMISVVFRWSSAPVTSDDATYVRFARALLETGRLDTHHFPIGFPVFLAPFLALGDFAFVAVRIVNVSFGVATIVIVHEIAKLLYDRRVGLLAAWITALYPPLAFMTGRIMSETVFIALMVLSLHQFLKSDATLEPRRTAVAGALFGLASLFRSNLVAMLPFVPLWYLLRRATSFRVRFVHGAVAAAFAGAVLLLPGLYFLSTKGEFIPFATNAGQTFYGANNPLANGGWVEVEDHPELLQSIPPEVRSSPSAYSKAQQRLGVEWIREHPGDFVRLLPKKFANAWIPGMQRSETTTRWPIAELILFLVSGFVSLTAIGAWIFQRPARRDGILLAVLVTYTIMSLAFYGNPRIGLFCAPVLIVYSAAMVARLLERFGVPWFRS